MSSFYQYEKTSFNYARLKLEIETEVKPVDLITSVGDTLTVSFEDDLTTEEESTLAGVISAHKNEPLAENPATVSLSSPKTDDGKPLFDVFPGSEGYKTWITSKGDHITEGRGKGVPMVIEFAVEDIGNKKSVDIDFIESVEIHDGQVSWRPATGWDHRDEFSVGLKFPATIVTENVSGTGNCNLVALGGGADMIVPAAGNGTHDVEGTAMVPVPAKDNPGFWDANFKSDTIAPSIPTKGGYNLFNFPIYAWMIRNVNCNHPMGVFDIDVYKVEPFHKSWKLVWEATKNSPGAGVMAAWVFCFRRNTT